MHPLNLGETAITAMDRMKTNSGTEDVFPLMAPPELRMPVA